MEITIDKKSPPNGGRELYRQEEEPEEKRCKAKKQKTQEKQLEEGLVELYLLGSDGLCLFEIGGGSDHSR